MFFKAHFIIIVSGVYIESCNRNKLLLMVIG